ncbi:MAG TPA: DUF4150 domain-containing protein [Polyangiaceae bacterium]|jgi:hypothetical protein
MPGLPVATLANGQCLAFPDVCKTPAGPVTVPIPYPNMGMCPTGVQPTTKVLVMCMPALTQGSKLPMSQGDDAGVEGGVVSGMIMGEIAFRTASSKVAFQGQKVIVLTATTAHNGASANAPMGVLLSPSQAKVLAAL